MARSKNGLWMPGDDGPVAAYIRSLTARGVGHRYRRRALDVLTRAIDQRNDLSMIGVGQIEDYMAARIRLGIRNSTMKLERSIMRGFFRWAVARQLCERNPTDAIPSPRVPAKDIDRRYHLDPLKVREMFPGDDYTAVIQRSAVRVLYCLGVRWCELHRIRSTDVDLEHGTVYVAPSKSGGDRRIPIADDVCRDAILDWVRVAPRRKLAQQTFSRTLKAESSRVGLPILTPHMFRHARITAWVEAGVPIMTVAMWAGHSDIKTTQLYAHPDPDRRAPPSGL